MAIDSSDQDLLGRVRDGDTAAFGELYAHHSAAAHRAARRIARDPHVAEDLVSESFVRVFSALRGENGPRGELFPYLLVTMRNVAATWGRDSVRWTPVGDDAAFAPRDARDVVSGADEAPVEGLSAMLSSQAFRTLPKRWRTVLWYLDVEGESAAEVGRRLDLNEVAVRQLARRAREGLREAYLTAYLGGTTPNGAHIPSSDLVQMARGTISIRRRGQVERHLDTCPRCTGLLFEAAEENSTLRALALPFYLVAALAVVNGAHHVAAWFTPVFGRVHGRVTQGAVAAGTVVAVVSVAILGANSFGPHAPRHPQAGTRATPAPSAGRIGAPASRSAPASSGSTGASGSSRSSGSTRPNGPKLPATPALIPVPTASPTTPYTTATTAPSPDGTVPANQTSSPPTAGVLPSGTSPSPNPATSPSAPIASAALSVDLSATPLVITPVGRVTVNFSVTNSGNLSISNIGASATVTAVPSGGAVPLTAACAAATLPAATLPAGTSTTCTITFTVIVTQVGGQKYVLDLRVSGTASNRQPVVANRSFAFTAGP